MLHEVLLVLAGYKSELIGENVQTLFSSTLDQLHPSEQTQLLQVSKFGELHHEIASRIRFIQSSYMKHGIVDEYKFKNSVFGGSYSSCCHAVCGVLDRDLLKSFQDTLIQIERQILDRDSLYVGGDNIVSLSFVTSKTIKEYERQFLYAKSLLYFLMENKERKAPPGTHEIIHKLMNDNTTGYKDIQILTTNLLIEVEGSWLRSLRSWIIYGRLPINNNKEELMIKQDKKTEEFYVKNVPPCINDAIASDILIIGNCLNKMDIFGITGSSENYSRTKTHFNYDKIVDSNIELLSSAILPISIGQFTNIIKNIRLTIYKDIVSTILPSDDILQFFKFLRNFALCGSSDFISIFCDLSEKKPDRVVTNKDHANQVFNNALTTSLEDTMATSWELDLSSKIFKYSPLTRQKSTDDRFDDFLFRIRCQLAIELFWPHNILMSTSDTEYYNVIFSYMSAIYRARSKLESLWKLKNLKKNSHELKRVANKAKIFLDILYDYAQRSVIDYEFESLKTKIQSQDREEEIDLDALILKHRQYLQNIIQKLWLDDKKTRSLLRKFLLKSITLSETVSNQIEQVELDILQDMDQILQKLEETPRISAEMSLLLLNLDMIKQ